MATSIGPADLNTLRADTIAEIELLLEILWQLFALFINPWPPADAPTAIRSYLDQIPGLLTSISGNIAVVFTGQFGSTHNLLYTLVTTVLGPFGKAAADDYTALLTDIFKAYSANLVGNKQTDPANVGTLAALALEEASALGVGSRVVTSLFELFLPKSLNFMNWLGPTLANFSGYDKIIELLRDPQLDAALGNLARYNANQQFRTEAPRHADAEEMFARRLITDVQLNKLIAWSGLMTEFEAPMLETAYRAIQPRMFATLLLDQPFPTAQVKDALEFAGLRPKDVDFLLPALELASTKNVRQQYLAAAVRSTELGTQTPAELDSDMTLLGYSDDAKNWVQLTVATRKLEQLAELYRKSISEAYRFGQITDDQYVPALEAIGIGAADAQAHYAIDSIALRGRTALAAARAEARLEASRTRAATSAAVAAYRSGTIDEAALSAALIAAGVDPEIAAFIVTVQTERRAGPLVFLYGLELSRQQALVLKENVAAVEAQYKKQLIDDAQAAAALSALGIPERNATPLLATWAALKTKPTTTGERLPR